MEPLPQPDARESTPTPAPSYDLTALQELSMDALLSRGDEAGFVPAAEVDRRELVFALQQHLAAPGAVGRGAGLLQLRPEGFGFLRSPAADCLPGADDIYVSANQIQRLRLRTGQRIQGSIRAPRAGENYFALLRVETVDGMPPGKRWRVVPFRYLPPVLPHTRLPHRGSDALRAIDALAPLAHGQRVLIPSGPDARRTEFLRELVANLTPAGPCETLVLSIDQRPEEQALLRTECRRHAHATLLATAFDEPAERHAELVDLAHARVQRAVEAGQNVVLLIDSITRIVKACNATVPHSGRVHSAGLDVAALLPAKRLFALARQTEPGPSVTVFATLETDPASRVDAAIRDEFAGRANATITLGDTGIRPSATRALWTDRYLTATEQRRLAATRAAMPADDDDALAAVLENPAP